MAYDFSQCDSKLTGAREWLVREYQGLRTGRATPAILDSIRVMAYGSSTPLKQVANVSTEDARTLRITAWDASVTKDIERGIAAADLGVGIVSDSSGIRVTFPELTAERRTQLIKVAKQKLEEARTAVRVARDEIKKDIQEKEREGEMSEDEKFKCNEEMQKRVDAANDALEKQFEKKEEEMSLK
jgi:ribosome recycling factor